MSTWSADIFVISTTDFNPAHTFLASFLAQLQISERRSSQYLLDGIYAFANVIVVEGAGVRGARCALSDRTLDWARQHLLLELHQLEGGRACCERLTIGGSLRHDAEVAVQDLDDWKEKCLSLCRTDTERAALQRLRLVWDLYAAHCHARVQAFDRFWSDESSLIRKEWEAQEASRRVIESRRAGDAPPR